MEMLVNRQTNKTNMKMKNNRVINIAIAIGIAMTSMVVNNVQAQYSHLYYHRTGDTIQYDSPIYYHGWWGFEESYHSRGQTAKIASGVLSCKEELSYHFTPVPLEVIGVAVATPVRPWDQSTQTFVPPTRQEYLLIYEATPDSIFKVVKIPIDPYADTSRFIHIRGRVHRGNESADTSRCCDGVRMDWLIPLTEYYLDSPVVVYDSFYVGISDYSDDFPPFSVCHPYSIIHASYDHARNGCERDDDVPSQGVSTNCYLNWPEIFIGYSYINVTGVPAGDTVYTNSNFIPLVFPIIQVDTTVPPAEYCPPVENLQVHNLGGGTVEVSWDAHPDHRYGYDVQTGLFGQPLSAWTTIYSEQNFVQIPGLQVGRGYYVRVRAYCDVEEVDISKWCQELMIIVGDTADVGVHPSPLSQHTTVAPNPVTHSVTVSSDYVILSLDLYDAAGRHLWNQPVSSRSTTLDVSHYAAGRYLLMVTTPQGTTPKALVKR